MEHESVNSQESEKAPLAYAAWDTCDIAKYHAEYLREEDPELSEDEALERAFSDQDLYEHEWDYLLESLTEKIGEINEEGYWFVSIDDFGWRNQSLRGMFEADDGKTFLQKVLPNCDCTFRIYVRDAEDGGKMFYIHNFHHDSPMGESYYVWPISAAKFHGEDEEGEEEDG